ncbi:bifunctional riboflavin kinase/FAD synthetase [Maribrevibacterium harenarium]|uniref:Riboflavin biosynthesis protein n=1 Tax=Maribrevibacterium harenarium TaxID=2589817 RepID=A0A501WKD6_9GAMM|nr:bifunctional riboflavin kinase/FAD synthetase [Maribrevibacterium harenarium]TPE49969.1 bifunctional riboflavin kinase/FAD synthetase [Maribrevibacterium harenarium]
MELVRGIANIQPKHRGCVLTIGNFDGVHAGHQAIIARVKKLAQEYGVPAGVMIFEPQPREFFARETAPGRITRLRDKLTLLRDLGVDFVLCMPFNQRLRTLDAQQFCQHILSEGLAIRHLVVGDDFHFGCDRQGDFDYLSDYGSAHGFSVENTPSVMGESGERISSTLVRDLLLAGELKAAQQALGHPMIMSGRVVGGQQLGRTLGFPTANVHLKGIIPALSGVYAVRMQVADAWYDGVANIGVRPTVTAKYPILEVHLFNVALNLYNQYVQVEFCRHIRPERKMSGLEELKQQIEKDKQEALRFFANP